jgi:hypothetical protein
MLSQVSIEHDNNYWVNCAKSQDCRRTLAGEVRTKAENDTYLLFLDPHTVIQIQKMFFLIEIHQVHQKIYRTPLNFLMHMMDS